jgi:hypothetical protein
MDDATLLQRAQEIRGGGRRHGGRNPAVVGKKWSRLLPWNVHGLNRRGRRGWIAPCRSAEGVMVFLTPMDTDKHRLKR